LKISDNLRERFKSIIGLLGGSKARPTVNGAEIQETIQRALASAGLETQSGPMKGVTDTIANSLSAAGLGSTSSSTEPKGQRVTLEGVAIKAPGTATEVASDVPSVTPPLPADSGRSGEFLIGSYSGEAGTRAYRLYVPANSTPAPSEAAPMIVMLHGCTQTPEDFAAGTRMNALAERHGFLVLYPAQAANANGQKCWNWFRPEDQQRDRGEPSLIAGMTRKIAAEHRVDERRIFAAGLSAGAAMAVILGATYPDVYAAVGAHSGLPFGAAHDMVSAFSAMRGAGRVGGSSMVKVASVPTIVFHGDADHTVNAKNGATIVEQATSGCVDEARLSSSIEQGVSGVRKYTRTILANGCNQPVVEEWVLHGAGHAWSGGSPEGSFTDSSGPDASSEMVRFFYAQLRAGTA
jgi:poly(hydroxyalkanoate) depolymerase family esterase